MKLSALKTLLAKLGDLDRFMPRLAGSRIENLTSIRALITKSRGIPGVEQFTTSLEQHPLFKTAASAVQVDDSSRAFLAYATALRDHLKTVQLVAASTDETKIESSESDIYVRFPKADDLPALTQQLSLLQKILEQTILDPKLSGKMEIKSVDNGSFIIQLYLGSVTAVMFVGGLSWASVVVYKKYQEALLVKMHVEALEIKVESLHELKNAQATMLKGVVAAEARHLEKETFGDEENPERIERIKHSIEMMQGLIEKGAEVHPALMAPEEVKNLFPDFKQLGSVESRIKQISEKTAA